MACSLRNIAMLCFLIQPMGTRVQSFDYTVLAVSVDKTGGLTAQNGSEADADGTRMAMNVGGEERMNTTRLVDQQLVVATSLANATSDTALNSSANTSSTELVLAGTRERRPSRAYRIFKKVKHGGQKVKRLFNLVAWAGFVSEKGKVLEMLTGGEPMGLLMALDTGPEAVLEVTGAALLTGAEALKNSPIFLAAGPVGLVSSGLSLVDSVIKMVQAGRDGNWCAVRINGVKFIATAVSMAISLAILTSEFGADGGVVVGSIAGASNFGIKKGCDFLLKKWCRIKASEEEARSDEAIILQNTDLTLNTWRGRQDELDDDEFSMVTSERSTRQQQADNDAIMTDLWPRYGSDAFEEHGQHDPSAAPILATVGIIHQLNKLGG